MVRQAAVISLILLVPASALRTAPAPAQSEAARGEQLFSGELRFHNGGPPCISCHSIAGLGFPNGGTLGPNLTHAYRKLGPEGAQAAMQTLYFKVMTPIYEAHPLDPGEQADVIAFLMQAESRPQSQWNTQILIVAALVLGGIFITLTGLVWRGRIRSVRRTLVYRATHQGART